MAAMIGLADPRPHGVGRVEDPFLAPALDDFGPTGVLDIAAATRRVRSKGEMRPRTLFRCAPLNACVAMKLRVRGAHPLDRLPDGALGTELRFPFEAGDPAGISVGIHTSDRRLHKVIREFVGIDPDRDRVAWVQDMGTLVRLESLPSFDPYIVKARLLRHDDGLDPLYAGASPLTLARIERAVVAHLRPAIGLAVTLGSGSRVPFEPAEADAVWQRMGVRVLGPLAMRLGVPKAQVPAVLDAWEALSYYAWRRSMLQAEWDGLTGWLREGLSWASAVGWRSAQVRAPFLLAAERLEAAVDAVDGALGDYASAYDDFFLDGRGPDVFGGVLVKAPEAERTVGAGLVAVNRAVGLWRRHRLGNPNRDMLLSERGQLAEALAQALLR